MDLKREEPKPTEPSCEETEFEFKKLEPIAHKDKVLPLEGYGGNKHDAVSVENEKNTDEFKYMAPVDSKLEEPRKLSVEEPKSESQELKSKALEEKFCRSKTARATKMARPRSRTGISRTSPSTRRLN